MKFHGEIEELKLLVQQARRVGEWSGDAKQWTFRGRDEVLNWWPSTGTLQCHGKGGKALEADLATLIGTAAGMEKHAAGNPRIFIVHGSEDDALDQLRLVLYTLGLEPLVQKNVDGKGMNLFQALMENISRESDFAIVLMTPDDYGYRKTQTE